MKIYVIYNYMIAPGMEFRQKKVFKIIKVKYIRELYREYQKMIFPIITRVLGF